MKILFVSMPSVHVTRWIENLEDTSLELFWFDVLGKGKLETLPSVKQFIDWKKRKIRYVKGEYLLKKKATSLYMRIQPILEVTANEKLEMIIQEIKPDIIHSFEMQNCCYPILTTMQKFSSIKWIYSCWGNDLYYYQHLKYHKTKIQTALKRINFLHTDCHRDYEIAKNLGFKGKYLGVIPGGTGYRISELETLKNPVSERKIILVKGYQHLFGRGLIIVRAMHEILEEIKDYEVIVFGAHQNVIEYISANNLPFKVYDRHGLNHQKLLELMGQSRLYIGNSLSDGMPNTLLEAIVMGVFPIQSNPGGVTEEIIDHGVNGLLINNPNSVNEIKGLVLQAIATPEIIERSSKLNQIIAEENFEYNFNRQKVIALYRKIENEL